MRRVPRPTRAIDPSVPLSIRPRCTHLSNASAAFSTTPPNAFLLPAGKQDKKKHQQFVRRWQKRLLGDSEPIGAHVDPYDPTSPVRIAPEEQGDYEEVLEEERGQYSNEFGDAQYFYLPAEELDPERPGDKLMHVGHEKWVQQKLESDMAKEFEKLTRRTYTPLSLEMANDIEEMTGTPYTLRNENLMMAQEVHQVTGRPYTRYNFGLQSLGSHDQVREPAELRNRFIQAIAEVYTLKEARMNLDIAKLPNRGVYRKPDWINDVKLYKTNSSKFALSYPNDVSAKEFLEIMQSVPEWESTQAVEQDEVLLEEAEDLLEPVLPQEPAPTMDPATPAFKRAAVVKIDPDKKPFDFMSNRPVPRAKPAQAEKVEEVLAVEEPAVQPAVLTVSRLAELTSAFETSNAAVNALRHIVIELRAQRLADDLAKLRKAARSSMPSSSLATEVEGVRWRHVPLRHMSIKFALFKRLYQLTGIRISDPHLNSSKTLGDLYGYLCAAAKPQTSKLFDGIRMEAQALQRAKLTASDQASSRQRADLADLLELGHVKVRGSKLSETEERTKTGMQKVIDYALYERGLHPQQDTLEPAPEKKRTHHPLGLDLRGSRRFEGTRDVPEFGRPVASGPLNKLIKATRKAAEEAQTKQLAESMNA